MAHLGGFIDEHICGSVPDDDEQNIYILPRQYTSAGEEEKSDQLANCFRRVSCSTSTIQQESETSPRKQGGTQSKQINPNPQQRQYSYS